MSVQCVSWVFSDSTAAGNDRMVLIAIADEADDDGTGAYPSVDRIARKAKVNRSTAMRSIERLEATGELLVKRPKVRGRGNHNFYVVVMGRNPVELARHVGWELPRAPVDNLREWSQAATISEQVKGSEWSHETPGMVAPGATRPVFRPIDPGGGARAKRKTTNADPLADTAAAQRKLMERNAKRAAGESCPRCDGGGWLQDDDGAYVDCDACDGTGVAA